MAIGYIDLGYIDLVPVTLTVCVASSVGGNDTAIVRIDTAHDINISQRTHPTHSTLMVM